jgi:cytochrome oxidase Cu insertion factor (SCO1/SenC/PrrC family)
MSTERRGQTQLLGLAALFFVPLAISFWLYYSGGWRPAGQTNKGELITPARPLAPATAATWSGHWTLVYVGNGACDGKCREALVFMRQTRLSLAAEADRVNRVFLATDGCCDKKYLDFYHPGLTVIDGASPPGNELVAAFTARDAAQREQSIYIVDPLGNLMMRHDVRPLSRDLLDDLKKLLKLSHIG